MRAANERTNQDGIFYLSQLRFYAQINQAGGDKAAKAAKSKKDAKMSNLQSNALTSNHAPNFSGFET